MGSFGANIFALFSVISVYMQVVEIESSPLSD